MFRKIVILIAAAALMVLLAACGSSNNKSTDPTAAQSLQPNINGYTVSGSQSITDALTTVGAGAALGSGNIPAAAAVGKAQSILGCMQSKGAADAKIYVENNPQDVIPEAGASIIINTTRVQNNLLECLTTGGGNNQITAQSVAVEPCASSGNFTYKGESFTYIYVGVGDRLCGFFNQHFESIKANNK